MLDSLLGRKFSAKCKQSIKCVKTRIDLIRKRKEATVNFLKKDVVDLLANGHDTNAIGRMDGLIVEMNRLHCYEMIDHFCELILSQLSCLQKKRECPQEEMEAMATLIFAAARFSDLPELGDLRHTFINRYGSTLGSGVNAEFMEKMSTKSFSQDKKLKLMETISQEFSISWNAKLFNKRINPSASDLSWNTSFPNSNMKQDLSVVALNGNNVAATRKQDMAVEIRKQEVSHSDRIHTDDKCSAFRRENSVVDSNVHSGTAATNKQDIAVEIRKQEASPYEGNHITNKQPALKQQRHAHVKDIHMVSSSKTSYAVEYIEKADEQKSEDPRGMEMSIPRSTAKGSHGDSNRGYQQHDTVKNTTRPSTAQNAHISPFHGRHAMELDFDKDRVNSTASQIKTNGENSFGNDVHNVSLGNSKKVSYLTKPENRNGLLDTNDQEGYEVLPNMKECGRTTKQMMQNERSEMMDSDKRESHTREPMMHDGRIGKIDNDRRERHARERKMCYDRIGKGETDGQERDAREMKFDRTEEMISTVKLQKYNHGIHVVDQHKNGNVPDQSKSLPGLFSEPEKQINRSIKHEDGVKNMNDRVRNMIPPYVKSNGNKDDDVTDHSYSIGTKESLTRMKDPTEAVNGYKMRKQQDGEYLAEQEPRLLDVKSFGHIPRNMIPPYVKSVSSKNGTLRENQMETCNSASDNQENGMSLPDRYIMQKDKSVTEKIPRPRSVRRKHSKMQMVDENNEDIDVESAGNQIPIETRRGERQKIGIVDNGSDIPILSERKHSVWQRTIPVEDEYSIQNPSERKLGDRQKTAALEHDHRIPTWDERKHSERRGTAFVGHEYCVPVLGERKLGAKPYTTTMEDDYGDQIQIERKHGDRRRRAVMEDKYGNQNPCERKNVERQERPVVRGEYGIHIPSGRKHGDRLGKATVEGAYDIQIPSEKKHGDAREKAIVEDYYRTETPNGRKHSERRKTAVIEEDYDEEEIFMDNLLMHYSRKGMTPSKSKARTRTKSADSVAEDDSVRTTKDIRRKDHHYRPGQEHAYGRTNSVPSKQVDEAETVKITLRAASMDDSAMSSQSAGRVHPRLPNYDELAARFHALKS